MKKYVGIITDGIIFKPYLPIIEKNKVTSISITTELDISKTLPGDIFYWFDVAWACLGFEISIEIKVHH